MAPSHLRWIVLASDGRHSTIGRDTAPDDAALAAAGAALANLGLAGWLVRLEGDYWARRNQPRSLAQAPPSSLSPAAKEMWVAMLAARQLHVRTASRLAQHALQQPHRSVRMVRRDRPQQRALVGPDMAGGLGWRITFIDERGPSGHLEYRELTEALQDALRQGFVAEQDVNPSEAPP